MSAKDLSKLVMLLCIGVGMLVFCGDSKSREPQVKVIIQLELTEKTDSKEAASTLPQSCHILLTLPTLLSLAAPVAVLGHSESFKRSSVSSAQ